MVSSANSSSFLTSSPLMFKRAVFPRILTSPAFVTSRQTSFAARESPWSSSENSPVAPGWLCSPSWMCRSRVMNFDDCVGCTMVHILLRLRGCLDLLLLVLQLIQLVV